MVVKHSVTTSLARALLGIVLLSGLTTGLALLTLMGSLRDAETVNIAGSLRMQSYRLAYDLATQSPKLSDHIAQYQHALQSPALAHLERFYIPKDVRQQHQKLLHSWQQLEKNIARQQPAIYRQQVADYVTQLDQFVLTLQRYAEQKLAVVVTISLSGFVAIIALVLFSIHFIRRRVVAPLNHLMAASINVQQGKFSYPPLDVDLPNELGVLSKSFTRMSDDLARLYQSLEQKVAEKTARLVQANQTLGILYDCSQALSVSQIDRQCFQNILNILYKSENLLSLKLDIGENTSSWQLTKGSPASAIPWHNVALIQEGITIGHLSWQCEQPLPHPQLMENVANMLSRGVYFNQLQKQHLQLMLMDERSTIARELHDSLAQALSYLRIQLTLLKRTLPDTATPRCWEIIDDFDRALSDAYVQLRQLLATFRLSIQQTSLKEALEQMIAPLKAQTPAIIRLHCALSSQSLNAQQQVHTLQIIREAVLNAIKHADPSQIDIECSVTLEGKNLIRIDDDGVGISNTEEPAGHYGLTIMHERAGRLGGTLTITHAEAGGTQVSLLFPQT